ncbi:hypothetical protein BDD26_3775 [Xenorhabdus cabanillasii]|uniref:Uncharacterized protein n=1 Tax=Xenorhabdus cabanillasii TaxID=351673 RepID=A0A3D9UVL3_9GAMM|nr:hypothetical protein Xcab_00940 [Xenorhabdus cabanillasii JM26]REF28811.1 hypothetical protein BDD26_3775 [Xenorhabdus cabanillasii]
MRDNIQNSLIKCYLVSRFCPKIFQDGHFLAMELSERMTLCLLTAEGN